MIEEFVIQRSLMEKIIGYLQTQPWGQVNGMMTELQLAINKTEQTHRSVVNGKNEQSTEAVQ